MAKILAIDDKNDNLISLKAIIQDAFPDSNMFTALDGPKGIKLAIAMDPDVILLDLLMPGMDGFEVCRQLKLDERVRDIPVIFLTAVKDNREKRIQALEIGAEAFLSKPIDETELTAQIRAMVKIKAASRQNRNEKDHLAKLVAERTQELELNQKENLRLLEDLKTENIAHQNTEEKLRKSEAQVRNKLKTIIDPEVDIGSLELSDIIDTDLLKSILEDFYQLTGILGAIVDISGKVLVAIGWQDICTKFHRCHPDTLKNCLESDTILNGTLQEGTFKAYRCKNNMWDVVTPLMVGSRHIGNVFMGQFFYEGEIPDAKLFREQARKYGFDEEDYLAALDRVPHFSKETVEHGMQFYKKLAAVISTLSFSAIQKSKLLTERKQTEEKITNQLNELRTWHKAMLNREERVLELKQEVNNLLIQDGKSVRYASAVSEDSEYPSHPLKL